MKYKFSLILIVTMLSYFSCEKCELIEQTIDDPNPMFDCPDLMANIGDPCDDDNPDTTNDMINGNCECVGGDQTFDCPDLMLNIGDPCDDGNPDTIDDVVNGNCECIGGGQIFDCPDLMLNIGDPCDDGNPDTENDTVNGLCECIGELVNSCEGIIYASRATINNQGNIDGWFLDSAIKAPGTPLVFSNIEEKTNGFLEPNVPFNTNFATFDLVNNVYAYAYQFDVGTPNPLYLAETNIFSSVFLEQELTYAAPVFLNGELYAINVQYDAPNASYDIVRIDQNTGISTLLFSDNLVVNSPMVNGAMSSTADDFGNIYFMSATNLIVYNPAGNFSTYADIDNSYSSGNQILYYGLEYKQDEDKLLAIKGKINSTETVAELVSITTDGNFTLNTIFDIKNNLGTENDEQIFVEFYSTTFSQCDNTYYISEIVELEVDPIKSFLIAINLNDNTLIEQQFDDFIYGLEINEN